MKNKSWTIKVIACIIVLILIFLCAIYGICRDLLELHEANVGITWVDDSSYFLEAEFVESSSDYHYFSSQDGIIYRVSREYFPKEYSNDCPYLLTMNSCETRENRTDDVVMVIWGCS